MRRADSLCRQSSEQLGTEFVVTKGLDGCSLFTQWRMAKHRSKFREVPLTTKDARKFSRFFLLVQIFGVDKQEESTPAVLREYAEVQKDVVLVVLNRIEIWDKNRWEDSNSYDDMDDCRTYGRSRTYI